MAAVVRSVDALSESSSNSGLYVELKCETIAGCSLDIH